MNNITFKKQMAISCHGQRLKTRGVFLVDTFVTRPLLPQIFHWRGRTMYRYMDRLFSPVPVNRMTEEYSRALCDLRLEYFDLLVAGNINKKVMDFFAKQMTEDGPQVKVLDFGCGNGCYTDMLARQAKVGAIIGADISNQAIAAARKHHPTRSWDFIDIYSGLPYPDGFFDTLVSSYVMHFVVSDYLLAELSRVLKPSGKFWFNIYHSKYLGENLIERLQANDFDTVLLPHTGFPAQHLLFKATKLSSTQCRHNRVTNVL